VTRLNPLAALAAAAVLALAGCGGGGDDDAKQSSGPVEITMWHGQDDNAGKVRVRLGLAAEGSPVMRLLDRDGDLRAVVGLASDGTPFVQFLDEGKEPTWTMR